MNNQFATNNKQEVLNMVGVLLDTCQSSLYSASKRYPYDNIYVHWDGLNWSVNWTSNELTGNRYVEVDEDGNIV